MTKDFAIRKATVKDVGVIVEMWDEFIPEVSNNIAKHNRKFKRQFELKKSASSNFKKFVSDKIKSSNALVLVAESDGVVGYSLSFIKNSVPVYVVDKTGYLSDLFVRKKFRGIGISTAFRKETIAFFKRKKVKYASIAVSPLNKHAHKIYKKWGFEDFHVEMRKKI